ncbi:MAG: alginate export family protein, partial [Bacteroidota bacterium]
YYLGFHSNQSAFSDVVGKETRHSFGLRSFGAFGKFSYNTELILQIGELAESNILAYNLESDWKYSFSNFKWKPKIGLKLDWSSGDATAADGKIGTFNPMFVNPGLYSLAAINTPANLTSLHPSITVFPLPKLIIYMDYAFFYRTKAADAFYSPPRFISRPGMEENSKHLGDALGIQIKYEFNRNLSFDLLSSYFLPGKFMEETGEAENIFFMAPTLNFRF